MKNAVENISRNAGNAANSVHNEARQPPGNSSHDKLQPADKLLSLTKGGLYKFLLKR